MLTCRSFSEPVLMNWVGSSGAMASARWLMKCAPARGVVTR